MGTWTYQNFQDYLKLEMGNNDALSSPVNYLAVWVNAAYQQLCNSNRFWGLKRNFYFPQLETSTTSSTVASQAYVATPTTAEIVRNVFDDTNKRGLRRISWRTYMDYSDRATSTAYGDPTEWVRSGSYIYLHATPDAVNSLTIYFKMRPTALSDLADVTAIGAEWDEVLLQLATIKGHMWLHDWDKVKVLKEEWLDMVSGIIGIYDQEDKARKDNVSMDPAYTAGNDYEA